jgi:hypothetical protein
VFGDEAAFEHVDHRDLRVAMPVRPATAMRPGCSGGQYAVALRA